MSSTEPEAAGEDASRPQEPELLTAGISTVDPHGSEDLVTDLPYRLRELIPVVVSVAAGAAVLVAGQRVEDTGTSPIGPQFWPTMVGWGMIGFGILLVFANVLRGVRPADIPEAMSWWGVGRFGLAAVVLVAYLMLWNVLQFWLITFVAIAVLTFLFGARSWKALTIFPAIVTAVLHFLFIVALRVPL